MKFFRKIKFLLQLIGIDINKMLTLRYSPSFINDMVLFKKMGGGNIKIYPVLTDKYDFAGNAKGEYFHQDIIVAQKIFKAKPIKHVDCGSRVDGFVAHIASFRKIEILDIRKLDDIGHDNITFIQANLMQDNPQLHNITDSLSCLHALEHFGLGRYGDEINPKGHIIGFNNLINLLTSGGTLYISFPISPTPKVYFNAHRFFNPSEILGWDKLDRLKLLQFDYLKNGENKIDMDYDIDRVRFEGLGIYTFLKTRHH